MKTQTAYILLKDGDTITPGCVWFSEEGPEPTGREHIGATFSVRCHVPHLRPVEVPVSEPEVDPYAELKAAHAEGKTIQHNSGSSIEVWSTILKPEWTSPPSQYRIKPVKVPLGPEDVPPGSVVRWEFQVGWVNIDYVAEEGIWVPISSPSAFWKWERLMEKCEISRDFGKTWEPCWKEVAQ